mmetsp:Transcript_58796/g.135629  ORF Transcript_58796/g.135629 Transcript_58796/m.135629 type:complete len:206 (+) Transcript_58796:1439-2056(+)
MAGAAARGWGWVGGLLARLPTPTCVSTRSPPGTMAARRTVLALEVSSLVSPSLARRGPTPPSSTARKWTSAPGPQPSRLARPSASPSTSPPRAAAVTSTPRPRSRRSTWTAPRPPSPCAPPRCSPRRTCGCSRTSRRSTRQTGAFSSISLCGGGSLWTTLGTGWCPWSPRRSRCTWRRGTPPSRGWSSWSPPPEPRTSTPTPRSS